MSAPAINDEWIRAADAARTLGIKYNTVIAAIIHGSIPSQQPEGRWHARFVRLEDVRKWYDRRRAAHCELGQRMRAWRWAHGLTQHDLAALLGTTHTYISRIEGGHRSPGATMTERINATINAPPPAVRPAVAGNTDPTPRQLDVLRVIWRSYCDAGHAPTIREMMAALGVASSTAVAGHLTYLERKGLVVVRLGESRGVSLTHAGLAALGPEALTDQARRLTDEATKLLDLAARLEMTDS